MTLSRGSNNLKLVARIQVTPMYYEADAFESLSSISYEERKKTT